MTSQESSILLPEPHPSTSKGQVPPQPHLPVVYSNANVCAINVHSTGNSFTEYVSAFHNVSDGELLNVEILALPQNVDLIPKNIDIPQNVHNTVGAVTSSSVTDLDFRHNNTTSFCPTLSHCNVTFNFYGANVEK